MKTATKTDLVSEYRTALLGFWSETLKVEPTEKAGVVIALPLMFPDGLQVTVRIEPLTERSLLISDSGETLGNLIGIGLNIESEAISELLHERIQIFEIKRSGFELQKVVRMPLEGVEIQIFAEALVSIAHLFYRHAPEVTVTNVVDDVVQQLFRDRSLQPQRNIFLQGKLEKRIKVDYFLNGKRPLALEAVKQRTDVLHYMERWGWRWTDLHQNNPALVRAMIYDPDNQHWNESALAIGQSVCDIFCPYFEQDRIAQGLEKIGLS